MSESDKLEFHKKQLEAQKTIAEAKAKAEQELVYDVTVAKQILDSVNEILPMYLNEKGLEFVIKYDKAKCSMIIDVLDLNFKTPDIPKIFKTLFMMMATPEHTKLTVQLERVANSEEWKIQITTYP